MDARIELRGVSHRYPGFLAVDDVSLSVAAGEVLVLLGGSGSGKTTTLKTINRLIEPTSGTILLEGEDTASLPGHELRRRIGYVFQGVGLFPHMTVAQNIGITCELLGWAPQDIVARVDELLVLVELDPSLGARMPDELSGGQQQRVGVARALAPRPRVMLFDEPFGALDPLTRHSLQMAVKRLQESLDLTAVFVTHDLAEAILLGDRIGVMHHGKLLQLDTPTALFRNPADDYVAAFLANAREQADLLHATIAGGADAG